MAGISDELNTLKTKEGTLQNNKVANFAYTNEAYNTDNANGVTNYNYNNDQNIPVGDANILTTNPTVLNKGFRSQASSLPRMFLNHFFGRISYNLNKVNDVVYLLLNKLIAFLGQPNGIATLDESGKIPYSQLPESSMVYKGNWNASTNTPQLSNGSGTAGWFYICSVPGTVNFGAGDITFYENDRAIYDGSVWSRLSAGEVKSVNTITPVKGNITITGSNIAESNNINKTIAEELNDLVGRHSTDITALLQAGGYIRLNKGAYTISQPVILPENTVIEGKGYDTVINCNNIANEYAITLSSNCTIKNVLFGGGNGTSIPSTDGGQGCIRIGTTDTPANNVLIDSVYIMAFNGYGILGLHSSGYTTYSDPIRICNVQVCYCYVGIAFGVPCQYAQISNSTFAHNCFGCACQDGNNLFVNCQFNGNNIGYHMNGAESPNWNAHGAVTGCQFNHNSQYSILLDNISAGQIFTGCVIFYGSLSVQHSKQVQFVGCELAFLGADSFTIANCTGTCILANNIIQRATSLLAIDTANAVMFNNKLADGTEFFVGSGTPSTNPTGKTLVQRTSDGSIQARWIISNAPVYTDENAPSLGSLAMFDNNGYLSKVSRTHFQKLISVFSFDSSTGTLTITQP